MSRSCFTIITTTHINSAVDVVINNVIIFVVVIIIIIKYVGYT